MSCFCPLTFLSSLLAFHTPGLLNQGVSISVTEAQLPPVCTRTVSPRALRRDAAP